MKGFKLKNLLTIMTVTLLASIAILPTEAHAAWRQSDSGNWSYTEENNSVLGWKQIDGQWYFFDANGTMKTGWINDGGSWYYLAASGEMKTGWISDGGKWYYMQPAGAMKTGWALDNNTWYYLDASGAMKTGLLELSGKTYYLNDSGAMATGNVTVNGVNYTFASNGEKVNSTAAAQANQNTTAATATGSTVASTGSSSAGGSGSSGGGSSSSSSSSSTKTSSYKDLYGNWTVGDCVSKGNASDIKIAICEGANLTIKDNEIEGSAHGISDSLPVTSVNEGSMTSSDFSKKYNVEVSGDKVSTVSTNLKYKDKNHNVTVYTATNKNNEQVHYASIDGSVFELKK